MSRKGGGVAGGAVVLIILTVPFVIINHLFYYQLIPLFSYVITMIIVRYREKDDEFTPYYITINPLYNPYTFTLISMIFVVILAKYDDYWTNEILDQQSEMEKLNMSYDEVRAWKDSAFDQKEKVMKILSTIWWCFIGAFFFVRHKAKKEGRKFFIYMHEIEEEVSKRKEEVKCAD